MKIYLASSWRNTEQPRVLELLRSWGHKVYDFRHPTLHDNGFQWKEADGEGPPTTVQRYLKAIMHPVAEHGFRLDYEAMRAADAFVLLLPCGRSAHLEAGWATGAKKPVIVYTRDGEEPELMYKLCRAIVSTDAELESVLSDLVDVFPADPEVPVRDLIARKAGDR